MEMQSTSTLSDHKEKIDQSPMLSMADVMAVRGMAMANMGDIASLESSMADLMNPAMGLLPSFRPPFHVPPGMGPTYPGALGKLDETLGLSAAHMAGMTGLGLSQTILPQAKMFQAAFPQNTRISKTSTPETSSVQTSLAETSVPRKKMRTMNQTSESQSSSTPSATETEKPRLLKCINCDHRTNDMSALMDHLDSHFSVRTYLCVHCTRCFPGPREFQAHNQPGQCPYRNL